MTGDIKIELTITADAVKALFSLLGLVREESREESTKEESKEESTTTATTTAYNNINNNIHVDDVVDVANPLSNNNVANPPTMDEVTEYIKEKGYNVNPFRFHTYYARLGWKTKGGTSILPNWKGTLDDWMNNGRSNVSVTMPVDKESREALKATHPFVPTEF